MISFIIECKSCGAQIQGEEGSLVLVCKYCGTLNTISKNIDINANLYNRANYLRRINEFDKAIEAYEQILKTDNTEYEAHFGIALCRFGVEFVEDPKTKERIPTCHRTQFEPIFTDPDYQSALDYAPEDVKRAYTHQAEQIDKIQKGILALAQKEEKYDVFLCYKESDENAARSEDSVIAQDIYFELQKRGYRTFFARKTLEGKLGSAYEPIIFAALNSAKVMVVLGTSPANFNAVWVKNEWNRYRSRLKKGDAVTIIPAYKNMSPYDLPPEFTSLQALDMSKIGFLQDLCDAAGRLIRGSHGTALSHESNYRKGGLIKRAYLFLEDGNFMQANDYLEKALDIDPEDAPAYIGKLMIELGCRQESELAEQTKPLSSYGNFQKALRFATPEQKQVYDQYNMAIVERIRMAYAQAQQREEEERQRLQREAEEARIQRLKLEEEARVENERRLEAARLQQEQKRRAKIKAWRIAGPILAGFIILFVIACVNINSPQYKYEKGLEYASIGRYTKAMEAFSEIPDYKDAAAQYTDSAYNEALWEAENGYPEDAAECFQSIIDYKDASTELLKIANQFYAEGKTWEALKYYDVLADRQNITDQLYTIANESFDKGLYGLALKAWRIANDPTYTAISVSMISAGANATVAVSYSGNSILTTGKNDNGQLDLSEWEGISTISAGYQHIAAITRDYSVIASGQNADGQCDTQDWENIAQVSAGGFFTVGLTEDGTVAATGNNDSGQCDVEDWENISQISAGGAHTVALQKDGTVVACGDNTYGQCDVENWKDIIAVAAGDRHTLGIKSDGTVVACGDNTYGQCDVSKMENVVSIEAGWNHSVALTSKGTVLAAGANESYQCDTQNWSDIVAISGGYTHTVGIKADGTVVATEHSLVSYYDQCAVEGWKVF